ncbi:MAG: hypothetical protein US60_C0054G0008 [Microgenomates group bacterium GW2011_GWC1_37_8]|uniref:Uncharacterized protein n=1 Tax=Candidatus Woesebacteria bacterium GW2011_GWB1_38_8 TaxID=1618570 RepID=A0A0G0LCR9_9BACT|nr:MAG: hypothetical protein US60_C0054G0008 [Microgenomates group bacterium GW2011_GWC1_37_8]KKQ85675.1 MAG: hypothetical protein UT08_C0005G0126 [Candidatus Woesebacteria bacterium GW2011_GWB1_38_8]
MKRRDIVIGLLVLVLLGGVLYWRQRNRVSEEMKVPETLSSIEEQIEDKFNLQIPEDVDKAEMKAVEGKSGTAIATRKFENGKFTHEVLADLPEAEAGAYYEGWLVKGEEGKEGHSLISTGRLSLAKGGWMLSFVSTKDYSDHEKVIVSFEKKADKTIEEPILEGTF